MARNIDLLLADDIELPTNATELNNFHEVSQEDVKEFAYKPLSKSCCLDPLPASLFKDCFPVLLPTITRMVNLSLTTGFMPDALKIASLSPALKKPTADFKQFTNFRSISNLKFISELAEKSVAVQLTKHVMTNHLDETFQSAYKEFTQLKQHYLEYKITSCVLWITTRRPYYFYETFLQHLTRWIMQY